MQTSMLPQQPVKPFQQQPKPQIELQLTSPLQHSQAPRVEDAKIQTTNISPTPRSLSVNPNKIVLESYATKQWLSKRYQRSVKESMLLKRDKNNLQNSEDLQNMYNELISDNDTQQPYHLDHRININNQPLTTPTAVAASTITTSNNTSTTNTTTTSPITSTKPRRKMIVKDFAEFLKEGHIDIPNTSELAQVLLGKSDGREMIHLSDFQKILMSSTINKKFHQQFQAYFQKSEHSAIPTEDSTGGGGIGEGRGRTRSNSSSDSLGNIITRIHFQKRRDRLIKKLKSPNQNAAGESTLMAKCAVLENLICLPQHSNVKQKLSEVNFKNTYVRQKDRDLLLEDLQQKRIPISKNAYQPPSYFQFNHSRRNSSIEPTTNPSNQQQQHLPQQQQQQQAKQQQQKQQLHLNNFRSLIANNNENQQILHQPQQISKTVSSSPRQITAYHLPLPDQSAPQDLPGFKFNRLSKYAFPRDSTSTSTSSSRRHNNSTLPATSLTIADESQNRIYNTSLTQQTSFSPAQIQSRQSTLSMVQQQSTTINYPAGNLPVLNSIRKSSLPPPNKTKQRGVVQPSTTLPFA